MRAGRALQSRGMISNIVSGGRAHMRRPGRRPSAGARKAGTCATASLPDPHRRRAAGAGEGRRRPAAKQRRFANARIGPADEAAEPIDEAPGAVDPGRAHTCRSVGFKVVNERGSFLFFI